MNIRYLEAFLTISEEGSISKAATRLGLTQPAVSRHVKELEKSLNTALFIRSHEGMTLTETGQLFYNDVQPTWHELQSKLDSFTPKKAVRLGVAPFISSTYLPQTLTYEDSNMDIMCTRTQENCLEFIPMLKKGEIDAAIFEDYPHHDGFYSTLVKHDEYQVALAEDHPLANFKELSLEQCFSYPQIVPPKTSRFYQMWQALREKNGWRRKDIQSLPHRSLFHSLKQNHAIAIIPKLMVEPPWNQHFLFKRLSNCPFTRDLYLFTAKKSYLKPLQQSLVNTLQR
ncbi:LysR family transcriptional regulator [Shouchella lehensis]|uniref:HTH-type, LysR family transcriptional regulator n=1 Tax=Shouchella lehensis G1 TaxID=1246626 RepID=A0A060LZH8_9BACI|nr:LysR family transcriptional regulator [Shouchella lehensis]AIC93718.1 HTH-type, LysR family transcriptional regulator [Shouchella lehensis G1]